MSTQPQTEEYLAARRESCRLLGLNPDDLTPHEMIRADLATVLRLWLDGSQSALLAGGNADPVKLLSVVEALTKLVPETEHRSRGEDPREYMWRTYCEMRARGAAFGEGLDGAKLTIERLKARVAELEAALAVSGVTNVTPAPVGGANAPAGDNVVLMPRSPSAPPKPAPQPQATGIICDDVDDRWRSFTRIDWQG
jgi:hypothetical protein